MKINKTNQVKNDKLRSIISKRNYVSRNIIVNLSKLYIIVLKVIPISTWNK